jgi:hypothetical protein
MNYVYFGWIHGRPIVVWSKPASQEQPFRIFSSNNILNRDPLTSVSTDIWQILLL